MVHSRLNVDFGRGFYVTPLREQAAKWCGKYKWRGKDGIISQYVYDESREGELKTQLFFDGLIDRTEAINRLRYEKPNLQICFRTEKALKFLHFERSEMV